MNFYFYFGFIQLFYIISLVLLCYKIERNKGRKKHKMSMVVKDKLLFFGTETGSSKIDIKSSLNELLKFNGCLIIVCTLFFIYKRW